MQKKISPEGVCLYKMKIFRVIVSGFFEIIYFVTDILLIRKKFKVIISSGLLKEYKFPNVRCWPVAEEKF